MGKPDNEIDPGKPFLLLSSFEGPWKSPHGGAGKLVLLVEVAVEQPE